MKLQNREGPEVNDWVHAAAGATTRVCRLAIKSSAQIQAVRQYQNEVYRSSYLSVKASEYVCNSN